MFNYMTDLEDVDIDPSCDRELEIKGAWWPWVWLSLLVMAFLCSQATT